MNKWYVYHLVDSRDDSVFYVGKGHNQRMYVHRTRALKWDAQGKRETRNVNKKLYNKILTILQNGFEIRYVIVQYFSDEQDCLNCEREEIKKIGLDKLCNLTEGGEGGKKSPETLKKTSESLRKFWDSQEGSLRRQEFSHMRMGEKNPMFGRVEDEHHKAKRMKNCLETRRWNTGLRGDPRCKGPKGAVPHNARPCIAVSSSGVRVRAESVARLSLQTGIPIVTLTRMLLIEGYQSRKWSKVWKVEFE